MEHVDWWTSQRCVLQQVCNGPPPRCGAAAAVIVHHCVLAEAVWNEGVPELLLINDIH